MQSCIEIRLIRALCIGGAALLSTVAKSSNIALIGRDAQGREELRSVPQNIYFETVRQAVAATHDSLLPELSCQEQQGRWKLHTIGVGVGMSATVALGPIISVQAGPKVILYYSRSQSPIFP